jgi:hypothetical protein
MLPANISGGNCRIARQPWAKHGYLRGWQRGHVYSAKFCGSIRPHPWPNFHSVCLTRLTLPEDSRQRWWGCDGMCVMMALLTFLPKGGYPLLTTNTTLSQLGKPAPTLVGVPYFCARWKFDRCTLGPDFCSV